MTRMAMPWSAVTRIVPRPASRTGKLKCGLLLAMGLIPAWAVADDIPAGPPTDVSITVYRAPDRQSFAAIDLSNVEGFALVSETRTVKLPAGESRLRFGGVADYIDASTVIITGLPTGVLEKDLDARLLSPSALVAMTVGHELSLVRTDSKTGQISRVSGVLRSDEEGVVFESNTGEIEALRCSGLPESFAFDPISEVRATPTLSARVRTSKPISATVKLTYLARGFDWSAHYTAVISPDGKSMDLGGWATLANANSVSFPESQTQVVAGRVNRDNGNIEPVDWGRGIVADCWPVGSTSDSPRHRKINRAEPVWDGPAQYTLEFADVVVYAHRINQPYNSIPMPSAAISSLSAPAVLMKEESLGDLKLYRVPQRTSINSRQAKQARLLDRQHVPLEHYYGRDIRDGDAVESTTLRHFLRARNDKAHQLALPLPAGMLSTFVEHGGVPLLVAETPLRDTALNEELKFDLGYAADVRLSSTSLNGEGRIDLSNAENEPVPVEVGLLLTVGTRLYKADSPVVIRDGHPNFQVTVPPHGRLSIHYKTRQAPKPAVSHQPLVQTHDCLCDAVSARTLASTRDQTAM
jgi:hypothetical protein